MAASSPADNLLVASISESESVRSTEEDASDEGTEVVDLTVLIGDDSTDEIGAGEATVTLVLMAGLSMWVTSSCSARVEVSTSPAGGNRSFPSDESSETFVLAFIPFFSLVESMTVLTTDRRGMQAWVEEDGPGGTYGIMNDSLGGAVVN